MSDEEMNRPASGSGEPELPEANPAGETPDPEESQTGGVRWAGPRDGKWPEVLPAPGGRAGGEEPTRPIAGHERPAPEEPGGEEKESAGAGDGQPEAGLPPAPEDAREEERNYRPIRFRRDGRIGCLGGLMYATFIICLSVVLACFAWMAASDVLALNKPALTVEVTLPDTAFEDREVEVKDSDGNVTGTKMVRAAKIDEIAGILKDYGLIQYKWLFKLYSGFSDADLHIDPGTYELSTSLDYRALVKKMQIGSDSQLQTLVTLPEGFTMEQIFVRLEESGVCSKADLYEAAATAEYSYAFLEGTAAGDASRLEGFLYPDTYYFYEGMQASSAINKFLSNLHYKLTADMYSAAAARGMTFQQIMTVASLIEKEAANDDERAKIASVIYNRLNAGMPLQIDSTVLYAYSLAGQELERLSVDSIQAMDSPYNTYLHTGLPPGPICNPGMPSIKAALYPADTSYLYYALDTETKTHRFFIYQDEHEAFVATQNYNTDSGAG